MSFADKMGDHEKNGSTVCMQGDTAFRRRPVTQGIGGITIRKRIPLACGCIKAMEVVTDMVGAAVMGGMVCIRVANSPRLTSNSSYSRNWQTDPRTDTNSSRSWRTILMDYMFPVPA